MRERLSDLRVLNLRDERPRHGVEDRAKDFLAAAPYVVFSQRPARVPSEEIYEALAGLERVRRAASPPNSTKFPADASWVPRAARSRADGQPSSSG